ncbi:MAG TPA: cell envelope integrity protein TolA [Nitrospiraceae bacterium]|nr:MAG: protein TolA [Nitrospirae bacterium GWA2_46_11]HCZ12522.1 cell envelope integrity protein TolA [Nitrospiraceae bacterium]
MKTSGIYTAFTGSFFLHVLIIIAAMLIARHSVVNRISMPYVVDIVDGPSAAVSEAKSASEDKSPAAGDIGSKPSDSKTKDVSKKQDAKKDDRRIKESIAALQAKKKIEKMAALRKVVDIGGNKASSQGRAAVSSKNIKAGARDSGGGDYYSMIVGKIRQQWVFPESIDRDLIAVINIKIARDGSVTVDKIEKGSGNPLFDRSALRAISKASPLPPPPQEMEMGVRFKP